MGKLSKVRMNISIASEAWSYQPGQVIEIDADLAKKWVRGGHATPVNGDTPLTRFDTLDGLADLSAAEALRHRCSSCDVRRARFVLRNKPFCPQCYRAELES